MRDASARIVSKYLVIGEVLFSDPVAGELEHLHLALEAQRNENTLTTVFIDDGWDDFNLRKSIGANEMGWFVGATHGRCEEDDEGPEESRKQKEDANGIAPRRRRLAPKTGHAGDLCQARCLLINSPGHVGIGNHFASGWLWAGRARLANCSQPLWFPLEANCR